MADFAAVLKKTLDKMGETTPEIRQKVYEKARETIRRQIDAMEKAPPQAAVDRQFAKLDDAISDIEAEYAPPVDDLDLDNILDDVVAEESAPVDPAEEAVAEVQSEPEPEVALEQELDVAAEPEVAADPAPETAPEPTAKKSEEAESLLDTVADVVPAAAAVGGSKIAEIKARARVNAAKMEAEAVAADVVPDVDPKMPEASTDPLEEFLHEQAASADDAVATVDTAIGDLKNAASSTSDDVLGEITVDVRGAANDAGESIDSLVAGAPGALGMPEEKPRSGGLIKTLLALAVIGGGGYYAYANQDMLKTRWSEQVVPWWQNLTAGDDASSAQVGEAEGESEGEVPVRTVTTTTIENDGGASDPALEETPAEITDVSGSEPQVKFTQRLTEDGTEIDDGPIDAVSDDAGEGSSVAPQTPGTATEAAGEPETEGANAEVVDETPAVGETITAEPSTPTPVGQRAIFYEERTGASDGTALAGATIWSVVNESPGGDLPVEPAIRAETTVPELGIQMEMTIRRNGDDTFPASHIIELFFRVPDTFEGRGIADVQRITLKTNEQDPGNALIAVPAPLDQNIFLVALTDAATAIETNTQLMRRENWIDIPMQCTSGRRALITFEKGIPGERVFNDVFAAWDATPIN